MIKHAFQNLFFPSGDIVSTETSSETVIFGKHNEVLLPLEQSFEELIGLVNERDEFSLDIGIEDEEQESFYSSSYKVADVIKCLQALLKDKEEEDVIQIKLVITKNIIHGVVSVYEFNSFLKYLFALGFDDLLGILKDLGLEQNPVVLHVFEDISFSTGMLYCTSNPEARNSFKFDPESRKRKIEKIRAVSHYGNSGQYSFLPEDFYFLEEKNVDIQFKLLLQNLSLIHCFVSLCDISENTRDGILFKLNGYKSIRGVLTLKNDAVNSLEEFWKIYNWTYDGGNSSDKVGLARNIISLHIDASFKLSGLPYQSIKSAYEVYLKQNIKQYIEIRNKITDQLIEFNKRANGLVDTFAGNFQKSIFAFLSFFTSVLVIRVLSKGDFTEIMPTGAFLLSLGFLAVAFVYLNFSRWELKAQEKRFSESYINMKERYRDLLVEEDITRILNNDKDFNSDVDFIRLKKRKYTTMWYLIISIFLILIVWLYYGTITSSEGSCSGLS